MKIALVGIAVWGLAAAVCGQEAEGSGKRWESQIYPILKNVVLSSD